MCTVSTKEVRLRKVTRLQSPNAPQPCERGNKWLLRQRRLGVQKCWEFHPEGVKCSVLLALSQKCSMKGCFSAWGSRSHHSNGAIYGSDENHKNYFIKHRESECTCRTRETTTDSSYLINCNIVTRLLKARGVVIPVPHDNPHLVENNSTNQLVGALDLHHNRRDVIRGLKERKENRCL